MANEITASCALSVTKNGNNVAGSNICITTLTGTEMTAVVQSLTDTPVQVEIGGCDNLAQLFIKNLSTVNSVQITDDDIGTYAVSTIGPGNAVLLNFPSPIMFAACSSGDADIFVVCVET